MRIVSLNFFYFKKLIFIFRYLIEFSTIIPFSFIIFSKRIAWNYQTLFSLFFVIFYSLISSWLSADSYAALIILITFAPTSTDVMHFSPLLIQSEKCCTSASIDP